MISRTTKTLANSLTKAVACQQHLRAFHASREMLVKITYDCAGEKTEVDAKIGETLLDIAHDNDIEVEGACGGELACSTCHCILEEHIFEGLPEPDEEEEDMLDLAWGLTDTSRLGCQVKVTEAMEGMVILVPDETSNLMD